MPATVRAKYSRARKYATKAKRKPPKARRAPVGGSRLPNLFKFKPINDYGTIPDPFPTRLVATTRYTDQFQIVTPAIQYSTPATENTYRLNSIFDTDYSGTGSTVVGHATLSEIYDSYIVTGARVRVSFDNPSWDGCNVFVSLNQNSTTITKTIDQMLRHNRVQHAVLNDSGNQHKAFNFDVKPWQVLGLSKLEWDANKSTRNAAINASPITPLILRLSAAPDTATAISVQVKIEVFMVTEFYGRKQLPVSV